MNKLSFKSLRYRMLNVLTLVLVLIVVSCSTEEEPQLFSKDISEFQLEKSKGITEYYGPAQPMATGVVRSVVMMNKDGEPLSIAVEFSERILLNLPDHHMELTLNLHKKAQDLVVDHIDFGWNPEGHEPPGLYDIPHFDLHYYWISEEEKMAMTNPVAADVLPEPQYIPATYFPTPGFVPMMGKHWLSTNANELGGNMFDQTFIYGSYDGDFIFHEPMITRDYFMAKDFEDSYTVALPAEVKEPNYYPSNYTIEYDQTRKTYRVSLTDFVWKS